MLHLDVVQERLQREYDIGLVISAPSVKYKLTLKDGATLEGRSQDSTTAVPCLGRSPRDERFYRVFGCMKQCRSEG